MNSPVFKTALRIFVFLLSITLVIGGIMLMRRQDFIAGVILLVVALGLFYFSARAIEKNKPTGEETTILKPRIIPALFILAAINLAGLLIFNLTDYNRTPELDRLATTEWILSVLGFCIGVLWLVRWRPARPETVLEWLKVNKTEVVLVGSLFLAGLAARLVFLMQHPYPWTGDEAEIGLEAVRILTQEKTYLFDTGWSGQPNASFLPTMFSILVFGQTMFAVKLVSVLMGALSVLAMYLLAREWFGMEIAVIASAFLVAYPVHLQFSRIGVGNIFDSLMAPLVLWLVFRASRSGKIATYLLAGLLTGLAFYLYAGTRLVLALAVGAFIYIAVTQKEFLRANMAQLGVYLGGLLVTINPIAIFFLLHPGLFMTRIGQEGIFLNGWLEQTMAQTGRTVWQVLLDQFVQTVRVFFTGGTAANFLNFDRPYLTVLGSVFFLLGYGYSLLRLFDRRHFVLQMWFWSVIILGGVLTINPPANTRLVMISPLMGLFIALGAWQVSTIFLHLNMKRTWVVALNALLLLVLTSQNLSFYFVHYWEERLFADMSGEVGMETGLELQQLGENYDYILFGDPIVYADIPTTVYLAPVNRKVNLTADTISEFSIQPGHGAFVVAIPENKHLLDRIMDQYPGGSLKTVNYKMMNEVLYYAYTLPPQTGSVP